MNTRTINQAQNLISQGLFNEAGIILQKIKKSSINDANYWYLLGICNASLKQYNNAEKNFKKAVKLAPIATHAWSNLGLSYLYQEKYSEAINAFKKAIKLDKNFIDAIYNLSVTYHKIGKFDKAIALAKQAININNNHFQAHNILGLCTQQTDINSSISSFSTAIKLNRTFYDAWNNLIDTYILHKRNDEAEQTIKSALTLFGTTVPLYKKLGELYESQNKQNEARAIYNDALKIEPNNLEIQIAIARTYFASSNFNECELILDTILHAHPEHLDAIVEKSYLLVAQRKYKEAYKLLTPVVERATEKPGIIIAYANACKLLNQADIATDKLINLTKKKLPNNILELAKFTLADIYNKNEDYEKAFQQYEAANTIFHDETDINYYKKIISSIISNLDEPTLKSLPHSKSTSKAPVFIVGMPRSGTTLVEQILSSHPKVYGAGEITDLWSIGNKISGAMNLANYAKNIQSISREQVEQYSHEYLQHIQHLSNNAERCTDKLPHNFFHIGLIELLFPNAKIIHCRRHPFDTCLSIYFKKFNDNHRYARNLKELAVFYKHYQLLMDHWHQNSQLKIYDAVYEDIVTNPEENIRQLVQHIELEWNDACLKHHESKRLIMTPSHSQASKPLYTSAINRWKNYSKHIQPLKDILGEPEEHI